MTTAARLSQGSQTITASPRSDEVDNAHAQRGRLVVRVWLCLLLLLVTIVNSGCGGCGGSSSAKFGQRVSGDELQEIIKKRKDREAQEKAQAEKRQAEEAARKKAAEAEKAKREEERRLQREAQRAARAAGVRVRQQPVVKKLSQHPAEIADWQKEDYYTACAEYNPRLFPAIEYLGENFVGNENAARLLANLLEKTGEQSGPDNGAEYASPRVVAMVLALGKNETQLARDTLAQLMAGEIHTEADTVARDTALRVLSTMPGAQGETILLKALTTASPEETSDSPSLGFASHVLDILRDSASSAFRVELAKAMFSPGFPLARRELFWNFLREPRIANLSAQTIIYQEFHAPRHYKMSLEKDFRSYGSALMSRLLGISSGASTSPAPVATPSPAAKQSRYASRRFGGGASRPQATAVKTTVSASPATILSNLDLLAQTTDNLWSESFCTYLTEQMFHMDSLHTQSGVIALTATLPFDPMRRKLHATLRRNWQDGSRPLHALAQTEKLAYDPAFYVIVKSLPRGYAASEEKGATNLELQYQRAVARQAIEDPNLRMALKSKDVIESQWFATSNVMLLGICRQLEYAARAREAAAKKAVGGEKSQPTFIDPIVLHEGARVVSRYQLHWPTDVPPDVTSRLPDPLTLCYVRIEETNDARKVLNYYKHRLPGCARHINDQGAWLESLKFDDDARKVHSLDVLIVRAKAGPFAPPEIGEKLTVEILSVELNDFTEKEDSGAQDKGLEARG